MEPESIRFQEGGFAMTILSSLYSGVSGLATNGNALSIIGDNIANVNTIGYKISRPTFADVMASSLAGAGRNQIGQGARMVSVDVQFTQGSFQTTTNPTDLSIDGKGFFILKDANGVYYTRAGQFNIDKSGDLVNPEGLQVQGYGVDTSGNITGALGKINITGVSSAPKATSSVEVDANLDSRETALGSSQTVLSGTSAGTSVSAGTTLTINLDGDGAQSITLAANSTGAAIAADIQSKVRALTAATSSNQPAFDNFTCTYNSSTGMYKLVSGTNTSSSSVSVTGGTAQSTLKLDSAGGVSTTGGFDVSDPLNTSNFSTALTVYDSLGNSHQLNIYFRKDAANDWSWYAVVNSSDNANGTGDQVQGRGNMMFSTAGVLSDQDSMTSPTGGFDFTGGGSLNQSISFDFGTPVSSSGTGSDGITQFGLTSATSFQNQDGYTSGSLQNITVSSDGLISGNFSNGRTSTIAQIALANFQSNEGLTRLGGNLFLESALSGQPIIGQPGSGGRGNVSSNSLEQSTVDLAQEFVNMITSQRGFQANSRTITTTDQLLQELINLKR